MELHRFDVAVLGGGPAGSVTAAYLARAGARVVLLERTPFPRFHVGESLSPGARPVLDELDLTEAVDQRYARSWGQRFSCTRTGRRQVLSYDEVLPAHRAYGWRCPRADFDALLLDRARALGVDVRCPALAEDVLVEHGFARGVRARYPDGAREGFLVSVVVDATGRDALLGSRLTTRAPLQGLDTTALYAHYHGVPRPSGPDGELFDLVLFPHGWLWHLPLPAGVCSVGAVCSGTWGRSRRRGETAEQFFARTLEDASALRAAVDQGRRLTPVHAVASVPYRCDPRVGDGWLLVGDAGGFVDPFPGTGLCNALHAGRSAARAVLDALDHGDVASGRFEPWARARTAADEAQAALARSLYAGELDEVLFASRTRAARRPLVQRLAGLPEAP